MGTTSPQSRADRARLVRSAVQGNRRAFGELVRGEERYMYALAVGRLADEHLARDAVQEALLVAWRNIGQLRSPAAFHSWLGRIVINTAIAMSQKKKAGEHLPLEDNLTAASPERTDEESGTLARKRLLAEAVSELDEERQMLLAMHYSQGLSYAEMSARLGITEDAVRGRLFQAREKLRARVKDRRP
jgi:RNA polymerase sigma-70 factor (ECF subfamily)